MELTITKEAEDTIKEMNTDNLSSLLLWYDTVGCGCGVNGLPTFRLIDDIKPHYQKVDNGSFSTYISEQQAVFFAKSMKLDYKNGTFKLSSPEGMLNPFIAASSIVDTDFK
ncbi:iron-sulfur cluster biosynthesis family protein [Oceanobacillus chungangensis]|uniref:Iron-sulfur cluster biosynthesis family protein n=1 Tax=Oceanobacillus chungangensis TaxID=1229152 RepID=A0A3D8Q0L5_9BACI|nr:iron-sulfur cluster biosynthesis family protein [Oceanobacillus chungangensis]RDW21986.1 iron-sulfur cluster biosynthesis family protein [Oceanobacillus chungangensis]